MASHIDHILSPRPIPTLQYPFSAPSPVICHVWNGKTYDRITLDTVYPFDTIDIIKYLIFNHYKSPDYLPRFTFVGLPQTSMAVIQAHGQDDIATPEEPTKKTQYIVVRSGEYH